MNTSKKFWFVFIAAILGMAIVACSCGSLESLLPTATSAPMPTSAPLPTVEPLPTIEPLPTSESINQADNPMPELAGYWQNGWKVFTIAWQDGKYMVTNINAAGAGTRTITSQTWDGSSLTWTYDFTDENGSSSYTFKTTSVDGDVLHADYSSDSGDSHSAKLYRISSTTPLYNDLPWTDDFSDDSSGWDIYDSDEESMGYKSGYYFVTSKTNEYSSYSLSGSYYGDVVITVDASPVSGPSDNNFSYNVGCHDQGNGDGYIFEVSGDGYFAVGYYTGGGSDYTSLLTGDNWQASSAIKKGLATNHLVVTCTTSQLKLEINGTMVYSGQDSTYSDGDLSLGAATYADDNTPAEVHFDNFSVTAP
jgi:hypothetical protein